MHRHEQLEVWKRSCALAASLQRQSLDARGALDRAAWLQITRASVSVPANIAEGSMRGSDRDFARFLSIAIGSAAELHTLLLVAASGGLMATQRAGAAAHEALELRRMLVSLRGRVLRLPRQQQHR